MYGGVVCAVCACVCACVCMWYVKCRNCQGLVNSKITQTGTESFTKIKKETKFCLTKVWELESLFEGLVDWGVGVQGGGTIVHELGGVVWGDGAEVAAVWRVGQAGHHCHHLCYLLLQLCDLLLPLVDLAWMRPRKQRHSYHSTESRKGGHLFSLSCGGGSRESLLHAGIAVGNIIHCY